MGWKSTWRRSRIPVNWRSYTEQYLDSTGIFRDAVIAILAVIAKQERIRRSERASAAVGRLRRRDEADRLGAKRLLVGHKLERCRELHEEGLPSADCENSVRFRR